MSDDDRVGFSRRALAGGIAVALLGMGTLGSSYALWSNEAEYASMHLESGVLDIAPIKEDALWDVTTIQPPGQVGMGSAPVTNHPGHPITDGHTIVPGDTVQITREFALAMKGDNLEGSLELVGWSNEVQGVDISYDIYVDDVLYASHLRDKKFVIPFVSQVSGSENGFALEKDTELSVDGAGYYVGEGDADVSVVIYATFPYHIEGQDYAQVVSYIGGLDATLTQHTAGESIGWNKGVGIDPSRVVVTPPPPPPAPAKADAEEMVPEEVVEEVFVEEYIEQAPEPSVDVVQPEA